MELTEPRHEANDVSVTVAVSVAVAVASQSRQSQESDSVQAEGSPVTTEVISFVCV